MAALLRRFLLDVVADASDELRQLRGVAARIPNAELRREALASITHKDFHVHGGCILATFLPKKVARDYVRLVAVFETAVDYLDNLCDRTGSQDEADFRALHEALADAVRPGAPLRQYFRHRAADDGGYLNGLVEKSQACFAALTSYDVIAPYVAEATRRYSELQALKHLPPGERERRCAETFAHVATEMQWFEGAAASGSTLPTFALVFGAIVGCDDARARELLQAYYPWISCFHILLDYFIDQAEDAAHGELNFVTSYGDPEAATAGLERVGRAALERARVTSDAGHHIFALRAMCGFYCTRPKVFEQGLQDRAGTIAGSVGVDVTASAWGLSRNRALGPLLALYRRVARP